MQTRTLGNTGAAISEIGLGSADWGTVYPADAQAILTRSVELGVNFIDTADVYGESDKHAGYVKTNPVTLPDFTATLFTALNINPASRLSPDGFTIPASEGRHIEALF